jgi:hypothetical protein
MKSFAACILLFAVASCLYAQTTNTAPVPAKATVAAPAEAPKSDTTNQVADAAPHYPVTAVVSNGVITFPILLSKTSEPLMTNAVFHRTFGRKVIFGADISVMSFDIDKLHPSVLAQLDLDTNKAKADQETLDKQNQAWAVQYQQQNQQLLAAQAAALKSQAAAQAAAQAASTNGAAGASPTPKHSRHANPNSQNPPPPPPAN